MTRRTAYLIGAMFVVTAAVTAARVFMRPSPIPGQYADVTTRPSIRPDYVDVTIPPNIAPMNFMVQEAGRAFSARISGAAGEVIEVGARGNKIVIPPDKWKLLLAANTGREITIEVFARGDDGRWRRFAPIHNRVAAEPIDGYLVYRLLDPSIHAWREVGLYQSDLETGQQTRILHSSPIHGNCCNCHTFGQNRADRMILHVRPNPERISAGMVVVRGGEIEKVDTRTTFYPSPAGFAAWHPSGKVLAVSVNNIKLFAHGATPEVRDQVDMDSDLAIYDLAERKMTFPPKLAVPDRLETFPAWSPDGKWLYFCSAPLLWTSPRDPTATSQPTVPPARYKEVQYDLMRVSYDAPTGNLGDVETVLSAAQTGKSVLEPKVSPDGRFVLLAMCHDGDVPIYRKDADLYLLNLDTRKWKRLDKCDSDMTEAWHSWSSNGRWIAFTSKRDDGTYARPYICHIDADGQDSKAFIMPQEDPAYYDSLMMTYNIPELVTGPVPVTERQLVEVIGRPSKAPSSMPVTGATPSAGGGTEQ